MIKQKIQSLLLLGVLVLSMALQTQGTVYAQNNIYNIEGGVSTKDDEDCNIDSSNSVDSKSTETTTSSAGASQADWTKPDTVAYKNAKYVFDEFIKAGVDGGFAAGVVGWINSEGGFAMVGRAEGHYGASLKENSIAYGVRPIGFAYYNSEAGGGIFQFTPFTKYAPLGSPDWENIEKMVAFVLKIVAEGDWNPAMDLTGKNHSFAEAVKISNPQEATLTWQAYERGNVAYINQSQKKQDAQTAYDLFNGSKYKYDEAKFSKYLGSNGGSSSNSSSSGETTTKIQRDKDLPNVNASDWELVLVNRDNKKAEMNPTLTKVGNIEVDSRISKNVEDFLAEAKEIDGAFHLISGYRSVNTQEWLYDSYVQKEMSERGISRDEAETITQTYSQPAGASEHQTGLAIDISTVDSLNEMPEATATKLKEVAEKHGFVRRFEKEYSKKTGIGFEDWHFRYVGIESAKYMNKKNISLEEYLEKLKEGGSSESDDCNDEGSSSVSNGGTGDWSKNKTGTVNHLNETGWRTDQLPDDLKKYAIDPKSVGLTWKKADGWKALAWEGNQCTDLSASLMYALWEKDGQHPTQTAGHGKMVVNNWVAKFGGKKSNTPTAGAVLSIEGGEFGHTAVVSHVFENGDILIVEQNSLGLSGQLNGEMFTWDYKYISKSGYSGWTFYDPAQNGYKITSKAKSLG